MTIRSFSPCIQNRQTDPVHRRRPFRGVGLGIGAQLGGIARWPQMRDLAAGKGDAQPVGDIERGDRAERFAEDRLDSSPIPRACSR